MADKKSKSKPAPNKSGQTPTKKLETTPAAEMEIDGKREKETVVAQLKMKNVSKHKVAFKLVCNHPFVISLVPNVGFIKKGAMVTVEVRRKPFKAESYDDLGRHTTLVLQHLEVAHEANNAVKIWAHATGGKSMKQRIRLKLMTDNGHVLGESVSEDDTTRTES